VLLRQMETQVNVDTGSAGASPAMTAWMKECLVARLKDRSLRVGKGGLPPPVFGQDKSGGKPTFLTFETFNLAADGVLEFKSDI
jgi:hypothetical protein